MERAGTFPLASFHKQHRMVAIYPAPTQAFLSPLEMTDELQKDVRRLNTGSAILQKGPECRSFW